MVLRTKGKDGRKNTLQKCENFIDRGALSGEFAVTAVTAVVVASIVVICGEDGVFKGVRR